MTAADSDAEASFREPTGSISQENQVQHHHDQNDAASDTDSDSDLKLWLQHTGYFNIEHRQKVLGALRKLKAIDEERSKILDEIRSSTEYFPGSSLSASTMPRSPTISESCSAEKPCYDVDYTFGSRPATLESPGEPCGSEVSSENKEVESDNWSVTFRNRPTPGQQHVQNAQPSIESTTPLDDPDYESQEAESPSSLDKSSEPESHVSTRRPMDHKRDQRHPVRPRLSTVQKRLPHLLRQQIQSLPRLRPNDHSSHSKHPPAKWMSTISWEPSAPFRIQWLNTRRTEFWKLGELRNPLNDGEPVFVGRDGQEFPEACGRKMLRVMDRGGGARERNGAASSWMTRTNVASLWTTRKTCDHADKDEISAWQHDESSEGGEVVSAGTEPEPVDDMPLIKY
ncbi:hypothetical protein TrVGV298_007252 [Trichoderma virens]|nr:hypothetical protein TrVGV298_007252 [Trichoderma virens]